MVLPILFAASLSSIIDFVLPIVPNSPGKHIYGAGALLAPDTVLTAAHVVDHDKRITIKCGETRIRGTVSKVATDWDLALVTLDLPCTKTKVARLADTPPEVGQSVSAVGYPGGFDRAVAAGVVSIIDFVELSGRIKLAMLVDAQIFPGNSGGPVFRGDEVVGVVTGRVCMGDFDEPTVCYGVATPVLLIRMFLQRKE